MKFLVLLITVSAFGIDTGIDNEINSVAPDLVIDWESNYTGFWNNINESRTLIRFDVQPTVETAEITLYTFRGEPGRTFSVYEIAENWKQNVTWNNQPKLGDKIVEFDTTGPWSVYYIEVPRVPAFGWEIKNDLGEMVPIEIWSFESYWPPILDFPNREPVEVESLGRIKSAFR